MVKQAKGGVGALLKASGTKKPAASKSQTPTVTAPEAMGQPLGELIRAKMALTAAKSRVEQLTGGLSEAAQELRLSRSKSDKTLVPTIKLAARWKEGTSDRSGTINFTQNSKFLKMKAEEAGDNLRREFGNKFQNFFIEKTSLKIDVSKLSDKQAEAIALALGDDAEDILEAETTIEPTDALRNGMVFDTKITGQVERMQQLGLCQPVAAYFTKESISL